MAEPTSAAAWAAIIAVVMLPLAFVTLWTDRVERMHHEREAARMSALEEEIRQQRAESALLRSQLRSLESDVELIFTLD